MCEARDAVANLEVFGDLVADLDDGARVVAADGAAFALFGERPEVDMLPAKVSIWELQYRTNGTNPTHQSVGLRATALTFTRT